MVNTVQWRQCCFKLQKKVLETFYTTLQVHDVIKSIRSRVFCFLLFVLYDFCICRDLQADNSGSICCNLFHPCLLDMWFLDTKWSVHSGVAHWSRLGTTGGYWYDALDARRIHWSWEVRLDRCCSSAGWNRTNDNQSHSYSHWIHGKHNIWSAYYDNSDRCTVDWQLV